MQLPALGEAMPAMRTEISAWETPQHIRVSVMIVIFIIF